MSYTTMLAPSTSLTILLATFSNTSYGTDYSNASCLLRTTLENMTSEENTKYFTSAEKSLMKPDSKKNILQAPLLGNTNSQIRLAGSCFINREQVWNTGSEFWLSTTEKTNSAYFTYPYYADPQSGTSKKSDVTAVSGIRPFVRIDISNILDMTFILQMPNGQTFKASPMGDRATKADYVENFDKKYKNHLGDCKYFEISDSGIPCQPKFTVFRFDLE